MPAWTSISIERMASSERCAVTLRSRLESACWIAAPMEPGSFPIDSGSVLASSRTELVISSIAPRGSSLGALDEAPDAGAASSLRSIMTILRSSGVAIGGNLRLKILSRHRLLRRAGFRKRRPPDRQAACAAPDATQTARTRAFPKTPLICKTRGSGNLKSGNLKMGKFADNYDTCMRPLERRIFAARRRRLIPLATGDVLEVGGGTGANLPFYRGVRSLTFTDPDPAMLRIAQSKPRPTDLPVTFRAAAAEALPFPDAGFDTVVVTLVLCSVASPARALAEIRRVLRPGGALLALEHIRPPGLLGYVADALTPLQKRLAAGCHLNRATRRAVAEAGFVIERETLSALDIVAEIEATTAPTPS
ncbi:MAG: hypothetical protein CFK52_09590 [Chloracidobacterium sp. CP2_5A]|nr:MAG: hypothetical protein CFK52_09590 [Chloracidobacterium sp. CP2_5A]